MGSKMDLHIQGIRGQSQNVVALDQFYLSLSIVQKQFMMDPDFHILNIPLLTLLPMIWRQK